jgi:hypothetical protein
MLQPQIFAFSKNAMANTDTKLMQLFVNVLKERYGQISIQMIDLVFNMFDLVSAQKAIWCQKLIFS